MCKLASILLLLTAVLLPWRAAAEDSSMMHLDFIPMWVPQAQFAGYYVAAEKGFFKEEGLDVAILEGGPSFPPSKLIEDGRAQVAMFFLASAMEKKAAGQDLVNISQVVQRSSLMLVARKASGILSPKDLNGKRAGLWGAEYSIQPMALFHQFNVKPDIVPQTVTINLFLRGGVDVCSAMWHNEYHTLLNSGIEASELTVFNFSDYGLNFPEDGLYVTRKFLDTQRKEACAFSRAAMRGWRSAFANEAETLDLVMRKAREAGLPTNRVHQQWMLRKMRDLILPDGTWEKAGALQRGDFDRVAAQLKKNSPSANLPTFEEFSANCEDHAASF